MFFDWFGRNWTPKIREPKPLWSCGPEIETKKTPTRKISSKDYLMTRAENIVWSLGLEENVAQYEKQVYKALKKYKELDEKDENTE